MVETAEKTHFSPQGNGHRKGLKGHSVRLRLSQDWNLGSFYSHSSPAPELTQPERHKVIEWISNESLQEESNGEPFTEWVMNRSLMERKRRVDALWRLKGKLKAWVPSQGVWAYRRCLPRER